MAGKTTTNAPAQPPAAGADDKKPKPAAAQPVSDNTAVLVNEAVMRRYPQAKR